MPDYTDDDVQAVVQALGRADYMPSGGAGDRARARLILDAVAPAIVARAKAEALREFADHRVGAQTPARMQEDLHEAADEIERAAREAQS